MGPTLLKYVSWIDRVRSVRWIYYVRYFGFRRYSFLIKFVISLDRDRRLLVNTRKFHTEWVKIAYWSLRSSLHAEKRVLNLQDLKRNSRNLFFIWPNRRDHGVTVFADFIWERFIICSRYNNCMPEFWLNQQQQHCVINLDSICTFWFTCNQFRCFFTIRNKWILKSTHFLRLNTNMHYRG